MRISLQLCFTPVNVAKRAEQVSRSETHVTTRATYTRPYLTAAHVTCERFVRASPLGPGYNTCTTALQPVFDVAPEMLLLCALLCYTRQRANVAPGCGMSPSRQKRGGASSNGAGAHLAPKARFRPQNGHKMGRSGGFGGESVIWREGAAFWRQTRCFGAKSGRGGQNFYIEHVELRPVDPSRLASARL